MSLKNWYILLYLYLNGIELNKIYGILNIANVKMSKRKPINEM